MPIFEDEDRMISDATNILIHLVQKSELTEPWYPQDADARKAVDKILDWAKNNIKEHLLKLVGLELAFPLIDHEPSVQHIEVMEVKIPEMLTQMNSWLSEHSHLAGSDMTIADLVVYSCLAQGVNILGLQLGSYPKVARWYNKLANMQVFQELEENLKSHAKNVVSTTLYGQKVFPPCNAALAFCKAAEIDVEFRHVLLESDKYVPEYLMENKDHDGNILVEGSLVITDTVEILKHLAGKNSVSEQWYPKEKKIRDRIDQVLAWLSQDFYPLHLDIFTREALAPIQGFYKDPKKLEKARWQYSIANEQLNNMLQEEYLCGSQPTIADMFVAACLVNSDFMNFDIQPYRQTRNWLRRMKETDGAKEVFKESISNYQLKMDAMMASFSS